MFFCIARGSRPEITYSLLRPMKILAVKDDAVSRAVLRQALRRLGHETVEAADGEAAWEALQIEPFRVVVSDWMMPRTDGLELCRRIRQRPDAEYIYFILLTSRDATRRTSARPPTRAWTTFSPSPSTCRSSGRGCAWRSVSCVSRSRSASSRRCFRFVRTAKNPRRQKLLAADRGLHQRAHRPRLQPFGVS